MNAYTVLAEVNKKIAEAEQFKAKFGWAKKFSIREVCNELSIFDWWNEYLSVSQLKQMKKFLEVAIIRGFDGYVCFKVGARHCSHGMWAHREESTTGYSPDGDCIFHSFRSGDNYYDAKLNGKWMYEGADKEEFTLKELDAALLAQKGE